VFGLHLVLVVLCVERVFICELLHWPKVVLISVQVLFAGLCNFHVRNLLHFRETSHSDDVVGRARDQTLIVPIFRNVHLYNPVVILF